MRTLLHAAPAALLGLGLSGCGQSLDAFFFNPNSVDAYELSDVVIPASLREQVSFDSGGFALAGVYVHNPEGARRDAFVLYSHGNGSNIDGYWHRVELLWQMGYEVFIYDYRGYGMSEGSPTEEGLYQDARAAWDEVTGSGGVAEDRIVLYGWSLGGCAATSLATEVEPVALLTEATFASGQMLVQEGSGLTMDGGLLLDGSFDTRSRMATLAGLPKLLMHGTADDFVRITHLDAILEVAAAPVEDWRAVGGEHSSVPEVDLDAYEARVNTFIDALIPPVTERPALP